MAERSIFQERLIMSDRRTRRFILRYLDDIGKGGYHITWEAVQIFRTALIAALEAMFYGANLLAAHAKRITLQPKDIKTLWKVCLDPNNTLMAREIRYQEQREERGGGSRR